MKPIVRLYDPQREVYNALGRKFAREFDQYIEPFLKKMFKRGYSVIDAERIMQNSLSYKTTLLRMGRGIKVIK